MLLSRHGAAAADAASRRTFARSASTLQPSRRAEASERRRLNPSTFSVFIAPFNHNASHL